MNTVSELQLAQRSENELGWLFAEFNMALARHKPFSREWKNAALGVEAVLRERKGRAHRPAPRPF